jgi:hypothetical protein
MRPITIEGWSARGGRYQPSFGAGADSGFACAKARETDRHGQNLRHDDLSYPAICTCLCGCLGNADVLKVSHLSRSPGARPHAAPALLAVALLLGVGTSISSAVGSGGAPGPTLIVGVAAQVTEPPRTPPTPSPSRSPTASPEATPTPAPASGEGGGDAPSPSPAPAAFAAQTAWVTGLHGLLSAVANLVLFFAAAALAVYLGSKLLPRLGVLLERGSELVVPPFANGTGDEKMAPILVGENARLRGDLARELERTRRRIEVSRKYADHAPADRSQLLNALAPSPEQVELPAGKLDPRINDLVASLSAAVPEKAKPLFGLISVAFPARGTQIACTVQHQPGPPDLLGLTVEITELDGPPASHPVTFWEEEPRAAPEPPTPDGVTHPAAERPTAEQLRAAMESLGSAGRYAEALGYARRALQLEPANQALAAESEQLAKLVSSQAVARAHHDAAGRLAAAGLREASAREYASAFQPPDAQRVESRWRVVLGLATGRAAEARRELGLWYLAASPRMVAEGLALLAAVAAGDVDTDDALKEAREREAGRLARASLNLSAVGDREAASVLATEAAALSPHSEGVKKEVERAAAAASAAPAPSEPAEARKARALYEIGRAFEERRAWAEAYSRYEAALAEDPTLAKAREGLQRVIEQQRDTSRRLTPIMSRAARWTAFALAQRAWLKRAEKAEAGPQERARIHNYFGMLYQSEGWAGHRDWLGLAAHELRTAIELDPEFYQPHQNLGETVALGARRRDQATGRREHRKAVLLYKEALRLAIQGPGNESPEEADKLLRARRRINIEKALSLLLMAPGDPEAARASRRAIRDADVRNWRPELHSEAGTAYDLACWLALYGAGKPEGYRDAAVCNLAIAVALDPAWEYAALKDQDLESIGHDVRRVVELVAASRASSGNDVPTLLQLAQGVVESLNTGGRNENGQA